MTRTLGSTADFGEYVAPPPLYRGMERRSFYLPLRDGVRLAVEVVLPRGLPSGTRIPALLQQTRYWRESELRAPFRWLLSPDDLNPDWKPMKPFLTGQGYALVTADVRGTGASFGVWPHPWAEDSIQDAREIVDWIVAQPWSNGRIGGMGISYVGTTAELLAAIQHPAVRAVVPQFNHPDGYVDVAFPGGVLNERFIQMWGHFDHVLDRNQVPAEFGVLGRLVMRGVKPVDGPEGRRLLAEAIRGHASNPDAYELARSATFRDEPPEGADVTMEAMAVHRHRAEIENSGVAVLGWGSWMDAGTADAAIRRFLTNPNARQAVIGAWEHGGRFNASPYRAPGAKVSPGLAGQWAEMVRFFDAYLKTAPALDGGEPDGDGQEGARSERAIYYYTLGEESWKRTPVWPPSGTKSERWYLAEGQALSPQPPADALGADQYSVDFSASTGELNRWWEMGGAWNRAVTYSGRAEAARHLLSYTTPPLAHDTELAGNAVVTLYITSTKPDGVFYVYLEDVDEAGRVTYVTEGQLRALHRKVSECPPYRLLVPYHSFRQADAQPLVPGEVAELTFGLLATSVLVRRGHCLRLGIAGHDQGTFPRVPARGNPVITVERNRVHASLIDLPVVSRT